MRNPPMVTCAGVITIDVIALVSSFPEQEGRMEAENILITGGGPASNAAVVLAKQGIPVAMAGCVGDDEAGQQAVELLTSYGIDVSGIEIDPTISTQTSCIIVDQSAGTRSIVTTKANPPQALSRKAQELITKSQWVHTDHLGYRAVTEICSTLERPPLVSLDSGNASIADLDLSRVHLFIPTVESLKDLVGESDLEAAARKALDLGTHAVVATDGSRGSYGWWDSRGAAYGAASQPGSTQADAYSNIHVVSTLGAGDVFHGGLVAALVRGEEWSQALMSANVTAALSCEGRDGRENVPTFDRLQEALATLK